MTGEIYILGCISEDAAKYIFDKKERELTEKFPPFFMYLCETSLRESAELSERVRKHAGRIRSVSDYCAEMGEGGILNALWYMAEELKTGLSISLRRIPVKQQTIEILELFDVNPYYSRSCGSWIVAARDPSDLVRVLKEAGIPYARIGSLNDQRARTILNGESVRYLDRPQSEELGKIQ